MSIVYDFSSIAARLRKDDFFTPTHRVEIKEPQCSNPCYHCDSLNTEYIANNGVPHWHCHDCGINVLA